MKNFLITILLAMLLAGMWSFLNEKAVIFINSVMIAYVYLNLSSKDIRNEK